MLSWLIDKRLKILDLRSQKRRLSLVACLVIATSLCQGGVVLVLGWSFQAVLEQPSVITPVLLISGLLFLAAVILVCHWIDMVSMILTVGSVYDFNYEFETKLLAKMVRYDRNIAERVGLGALQCYLTYTKPYVHEVARFIFLSIIMVARLVIYSVIMIYSSWFLYLLLVPSLVVVSWVRSAVMNRHARMTEKPFQTADEQREIIRDIFENIHRVKIRGTEKLEIEKHERAARLFRDSYIKTDRMFFLKQCVDRTLLAWGALFIGATGFFLFHFMKVFSPASLVLFVGAMYQGVACYSRFHSALVSWEAVMPVWNRILDLLAEPDPADDAEGRPLTAIRHSIEFKQIAFSYASRHQLLKDIRLTIPARTLGMITGPVGVGKSTLINILLRLRTPQAGSIWIDGRNADEFATRDIRNRICVVPQEMGVFRGTLRDNVVYGLDAGIDLEHEVRALNYPVEFISRLPARWDEWIGDKGYRISSGEKQLLLILNAILRKPDVLVFDESFSHMDIASVQRVFDIFMKLKQTTTIVIVSHDVHLASKTDWTVWLADGKADRHTRPDLTSPRQAEPELGSPTWTASNSENLKVLNI